MMPALLICRPQPGADASAARARAVGLEPRIYPLFIVEPVAWTPPDPTLFDAIMLTSANALRHGSTGLDRYVHMPSFAVGEATAQAAMGRGFTRVNTTGPDAQSTVEAVRRAGHERVLHLCGEDVRPYDAGDSAVMRCPVYRSAENGDEAGLSVVLTDDPILLVHSPRAGKRLQSLIAPERKAALTIVSISDTAKEACGPGWRAVYTAPTPDDPAMLALTQKLCL